MKTPAFAVFVASVAEPLAFMGIVVWLEPLILYVTTTGKAIGFAKVIMGALACWQTLVVPLIVAEGEGSTVTVVDTEAEGALHPLAVTLIVASPEKPGAQVTVPVVPVPDIVLPVPVTCQM